MRQQLGELSSRIGNDDWLGAKFSAGDLLVVTELRRLGRSGLPDGRPNLAAYDATGEARPAYNRAFDAQLTFSLSEYKLKDGTLSHRKARQLMN